MLPSSPHVHQVYLDSSGIVPALRSLSPADASNTLCIDSTTLDVQVGRDVAAVVHSAGAGMVDAPVSGGIFYGYYGNQDVLSLHASFFRCDRCQRRDAVFSRWR
jgi:hypothetical protein